MHKQRSKKKIIKADLLLLLVVAIWGTTFPIMKIALVEVGPFYFIALRFLIAFTAVSVIFRDQLKEINRQILKKGFILGLWLFGAYAFQIAGLQYTTASRSGFITGLSVVLVPILSVLLLKQIPDKLTWMGVVLAFIGLFLLTGAGGATVNLGDILTFFCALSIAMQIVFLSKFIEGENPVLLTWTQLGVVAAGGIIFSIAGNEIKEVTPIVGGVALYTGLFASAFAYLIQSHAQQYTSSTHTGLIFSLEPVFAAVFAFLILQEMIGGGGIAGGILIVIGMLISELRLQF